MEQINTNKWKRASSESLFTTLIPPMNGNSWLQKTPFIFFRLKNFNTLVPLEAKAKDGSDGDAHGAGQTGQTGVSIHLLEQTCHSSHAPGTPTPLLSTRESGDTGNHSKNLPVPSAAVPRCAWGTLGACSTSSECAGFLSSPQFSWQFCGRALWGDFFQHSAWFSLGRCWCSVEELKGSLERRQSLQRQSSRGRLNTPKNMKKSCSLFNLTSQQSVTLVASLQGEGRAAPTGRVRRRLLCCRALPSYTNLCGAVWVALKSNANQEWIQMWGNKYRERARFHFFHIFWNCSDCWFIKINHGAGHPILDQIFMKILKT